MTKLDKIKDSAYMIFNDMSFNYVKQDNNLVLVAINLKNTNQTSQFCIRGDRFIFVDGNMSKENTYKAMLIVEKNNHRFVEGMHKWGNILSIK